MILHIVTVTCTIMALLVPASTIHQSCTMLCRILMHLFSAMTSGPHQSIHFLKGAWQALSQLRQPANICRTSCEYFLRSLG